MRPAALDPRPRMLSPAPWAIAIVVAWLTVFIGTSIQWREYAIASLLLLVAAGLRLLRTTRPSVTRRLPSTSASLVFFCALGLLCDAAGGPSSGVAVLVLVPIVYTALYSARQRDMLVVAAGTAGFYLIPILAIGPPAYPSSQYRAAVLAIVISSMVGLITQRLVADARARAADSQHRGQMLEQVNERLRELNRSSQARTDVCNAAMTIGDASVAMIYEPSREGFMRATAMAGIEAAPREISMDRHTAIRDAFVTRLPVLITEDVEAHVGSIELWRQAGEPQSVLYEPLLRGDEPLGVLVVAWPREVGHPGPRATIVSLLAHEVVGVIERSDLVSELTDMSQTDPLTGIPNRRTWDSGLDAALRRGEAFAIAIIDLDHFKDFNDSNGHPAGDRLLREVAAIWRGQLRSGDILARIGGEEFGLLLARGEAARVHEVIERLRRLVPYEQTCSAGFAVHRRGESAESLMARADAALYEAKTTGRDRALMAA